MSMLSKDNSGMCLQIREVLTVTLVETLRMCQYTQQEVGSQVIQQIHPSGLYMSPVNGTCHPNPRGNFRYRGISFWKS